YPSIFSAPIPSLDFLCISLEILAPETFPASLSDLVDQTRTADSIVDREAVQSGNSGCY
ncbi:hypothetical protein BHE74_00019017, partial [Ensete ventricosum]